MAEQAATSEGEYRCQSCGDVLNIIGLVDHGCDTILDAAELSSHERNTLMYIENRVVDHQGKLAHSQMNVEDHQNMKVFRAAGILQTEDAHPPPSSDELTRVVKFTDRAWDLARDSRQMRAADWIEYEADLGDVDG